MIGESAVGEAISRKREMEAARSTERYEINCASANLLNSVFIKFTGTEIKVERSEQF
jgi:hypothetical protein